MKSKSICAVLITLSLGVLGATIASAQSPATPAATPQATAQNQAVAQQQMIMAVEPNYVLATAYHQSLLAFAKALHGQAVGAKPVNVKFARDAVAEMRRGFDMMQKYNEEYMETVSAEVRTTMAPMMQEMETHRADLNVQLKALEKEVALDVPDSKKVASLTTVVQTQLDAMSMLDETNPLSKLSMKM